MFWIEYKIVKYKVKGKISWPTNILKFDQVMALILHLYVAKS